MFRMICITAQSANSRNVKHDVIMFVIVDFGCVCEIFLVFTKLWPFKDGASCAHGGGHDQAFYFLRISRAVLFCNIHPTVKCKLQVLLLLMEQDLMFLFCGAFSPVIFVLVSVQMKYFPMNICCCHFLLSKQNESILVMCALLVHNQCIDCLLGGCLV